MDYTGCVFSARVCVFCLCVCFLLVCVMLETADYEQRLNLLHLCRKGFCAETMLSNLHEARSHAEPVEHFNPWKLEGIKMELDESDARAHLCANMRLLDFRHSYRHKG